MGACFSKKKNKEDQNPNPNPNPSPIPKEKTPPAKIKEETTTAAAPKTEEIAKCRTSFEKKPVFVIAQTPPQKKKTEDESFNQKKSANVDVAIASSVTARTSSCTKDEVEAILIQCGRLSRSSSAKTSGDRKYSGSKRSYDFDNEKNEEESWDDKKQMQQQRSRPSPRRRTPNRERSGSRERGGSQRRVSRSPVRRSDAPASSNSEKLKQQQPAKMVSVPARENGEQQSVAVVGVKRPTSSTIINKRNASPRSRSPANVNNRVSNENLPSLSRSSSRKQEQSPFRRNPMSEIDDNSLIRASNNKVQTQDGAKSSKSNSSSTSISNCIRDQLMSCRAKEKQAEPEIVEESLNNQKITRTRSSRRSSRDLDNLNVGVGTYPSLLLEDIQNYHQQNVGFSLPACVSKACSIMEAVADLNSSSSDQSNNENGRFGRRGLMPDEVFVESEIGAKDDIMEPSMHKYVSVRDIGGGEMDQPQESAGSNSFVGQPWATTAWELNSVDSTDRYRTSQSNNEEDGENVRESDARGVSFSSGFQSGIGSSSKKRDVDHHRGQIRGGGGVGKGGGRAYSLPLASATS